ncbi:MAG TPA: BlaI/MecI/CopY family transcriptional regulator [Gemmatimonadaceae bacterium]|nr:BlaI/MecI/CopY family transcriptional regulator [Gemmatimonadaceae bacterium]
MPDATTLTGLQLAVMRAIWERGEATVTDVHRALTRRRLAPTTVATLLARLEERGLLQHRTDGRQYVYSATVTETDVRRSMVSELTDLLFDGDPAELVTHLVRDREISRGDLARVRKMLDEHDKRRQR